jgi:hypothetical protein
MTNIMVLICQRDKILSFISKLWIDLSARKIPNSSLSILNSYYLWFIYLTLSTTHTASCLTALKILYLNNDIPCFSAIHSSVLLSISNRIWFHKKKPSCHYTGLFLSFFMFIYFMTNKSVSLIYFQLRIISLSIFKEILF